MTLINSASEIRDPNLLPLSIGPSRDMGEIAHSPKGNRRG
jgi:hypothetical protein